jgi:hypothetical protein
MIPNAVPALLLPLKPGNEIENRQAQILIAPWRAELQSSVVTARSDVVCPVALTQLDPAPAATGSQDLTATRIVSTPSLSVSTQVAGRSVVPNRNVPPRFAEVTIFPSQLIRAFLAACIPKT